jgi:hypothetical protein
MPHGRLRPFIGIASRSTPSRDPHHDPESWKFEDEGEKYDCDKTDSFGDPITVGSWQSQGIGFVAGCLWGDDSSWKLEVFDLSRAKEGILSRSARFGHLQLADGLPLAKAVRLHRYPPASLRANILQQQEVGCQFRCTD